ncbi:MAG: HupE/UreJ family protein [Gemmatimonadota bacterium]|nr:HupE/UreJ family protein [Gemmatimonadota bacterium]MDQ8152328.1 HupE/UreJ family protein [Gemmatimonadota bacterium]MDQ8178246.1 HupE/UreJ family protein [Gemmatimonadota bacterium]
MLDTLTPILLGALLGLRHATDADHVVAVTTIVARQRSWLQAARIGAVWGIGHSVTLFLLGGAIIGFRLVIPPRIGLGLEFAVALMLIGLGYANLRQRDEPSAPSLHRPFWIGVVHGLAGSAAVALLVLSTIRAPLAAAAYLLMFGFGTIVGMMLVTLLLAAPTVYAGARVARMQGSVRLAAGALSIVFGLLLARELIVDGGLFSAVPTWDPH